MERVAMNYELITKGDALESAIENITKAGEVSIDLEFDKNRLRYGFNLCLMQLATRNHNYLIDPLSPTLDINTVFGILEDSSIKKVAFEFGEDRKLLNSMGCFPKGLEDISIASKLLGYSQVSLGNLLKEVLEIEISGGEQMSNWFNRPLTAQQCNYAVNDVVHLIRLKEALLKKLQALNDDRLAWYSAENEFSSQQVKDDELPNHSDEGIHLKNEEKNALNQLAYHALKALYDFRLTIAKQYNRPVFMVITHKGLMDMVLAGPDAARVNEKEVGIKSLRTEAFKNRIIEVFKNAWRHGQECGLKQSEPAFLPLDPEEKKLLREKQKTINRIIETEWTPVQGVLRATYGQEIATFLLSNRLMKRLASGELVSIPPYRLALFESIRLAMNGAQA
jgi:ribonuclease D